MNAITFTEMGANVGFDSLPQYEFSNNKSSMRELIRSSSGSTNITPVYNEMESKAGSGYFSNNNLAATFASAVGTSSTIDTLASLKVANMIVAEYGLDLAYKAISDLLEAYNKITAEQLADFCEVSTDRLRRYGTPALMSMMELSEFGMPDPQKIRPGYTVGFPLKRAGIALQWTWQYFRNATTVELAGQLQALMVGDSRYIQAQIKNALFNPTSYIFQDYLQDFVGLNVKALANAEAGLQLPVGPNGEIFASTHNHFMYPGSGNGDSGSYGYNGIPTYTSFAWNGGSATPTSIAADMAALIGNVVEHGNDPSTNIMLVANRAQETQIRSAPGFTPLYDSRVIPQITIDIGKGNLDVNSIYDRLIGYFDGASVWIKPWAPSSYLLCFLSGGGTEPPLLVRVPDDKSIGGSASGVAGSVGLGKGELQIVSTSEQFPYYAQGMERRFGIGVWNRVNGAVMYLNSTTAYTAPTFTY